MDLIYVKETMTSIIKHAPLHVQQLWIVNAQINLSQFAPLCDRIIWESKEKNVKRTRRNIYRYTIYKYTSPEKAKIRTNKS